MADKELTPLSHLVFIDTNILQYVSDSPFSAELISFIKDLLDEGFYLVISDISICELLSGCSISKEKRCLYILETFQRYIVDENVLIEAARLQSIYKSEGIQEDQIGLADRIIAATAILTESYILTANVNDFPRPIFSEVKEKQLFYKKKNKTQMQVVQILKPNLPIILHKMNTRS